MHSGGEWLSSPLSENWMTRKRKRHIGEFAEKHHISISVDWLLDGDLEGRLRIPAMTWPSAGSQHEASAPVDEKAQTGSDGERMRDGSGGNGLLTFRASIRR